MDDVVMVMLVLGASALAIALLVVLNLLLGGWEPARLRSSDDAARALAEGVYGFKAAAPVTLDADGAGALAREDGGARLGLVLAVGDRMAVRALSPGELKTVTREGARLTLIMTDYTLPRAVLRFADAQEAQQWEAAALKFVGDAPAPVKQEARHA